MASPKHWLQAFRLRTLPLSLSGIIAGSMYALHTGKWDATVFILALCTTLFFQVLSNLANDLGDTLKGADNSERVGPQRTVQSGAITVAQMKRAVVIFSALSFVSAGLLIWQGTKGLPPAMIWLYAVLAVACVLAAITYTIGKRAYGYHGFGDIFVFIFFGCVSVIGVFPLIAKELVYEIALPAITIGCLSTAVLNLNNMRDIVNDAAVGKRTLVVQLGGQRAKFYHTGLIFTALLAWTIFLITTKSWPGLISVLPFFLLMKHVAFVNRNNEPRKFDPELKKVALSTFLITVLYAISVLVAPWIG
jgi:1,4-dihydroxy-2-naphthoate polyprenyltransferase